MEKTIEKYVLATPAPSIPTAIELAAMPYSEMMSELATHGKRGRAIQCVTDDVECFEVLAIMKDGFAIEKTINPKRCHYRINGESVSSYSFNKMLEKGFIRRGN